MAGLETGIGATMTELLRRPMSDFFFTVSSDFGVLVEKSVSDLLTAGRRVRATTEQIVSKSVRRWRMRCKSKEASGLCEVFAQVWQAFIFSANPL